MPRYISNKDSGGTILGQSTTDLVGFWGKTARVPITFVVSVSAAQTTAVVKARLNLIRTGLINIGLMKSS